MIRIDNIKISAKQNIYVKEFVVSKYNLNRDCISDFKILKKSLDSRDKNNILYVYSVMISVDSKSEKNLLKKKEISAYKPTVYKVSSANNSNQRVIIIGCGPAGLFAAYVLALSGLNPLIFERGSRIEERIKNVDEFFGNNSINPESNIQFGEGGAGTFSDGKLNTSVKDINGYKDFVLETFVKFGAKDNILYDSKPHIGTDILQKVIVNMRNEIIRLGGEFHFDSRFVSYESQNGVVKSVGIEHNHKITDYPCDKVILAIGHSSRDTFEYLKDKLVMEQKPFAMGFRVIHKQSDIDISQYGEDFESLYEDLPPCSYKLTYQSDKYKRGIYSFCMCPGGYVVNASSQEKCTCVNGMSLNARDSGYANSAVIVQIKPEDIKDKEDILAGMKFQELIESRTYRLGNGKIPVCKYSDFEKSDYEYSNSFDDIPKDAFKGDCIAADLTDIYPSYINEAFKEGINDFEFKIKGFKSLNPIIAGCETRTSSPLKILRNDSFESNIKGIYPCGEGAGYAGGIVSAAMDGIKIADIIYKEC